MDLHVKYVSHVINYASKSIIDFTGEGQAYKLEN